MKNHLKEFIQATQPNTEYANRCRLICKDGFNMSVQASKLHYCIPKEDNAEYTRVEVGYPSEHEPLLDEYHDGDGEFASTTSVFPWVRAAAINAIIDVHGGIDWKAMFEEEYKHSKEHKVYG